MTGAPLVHPLVAPGRPGYDPDSHWIRLWAPGMPHPFALDVTVGDRDKGFFAPRKTVDGCGRLWTVVDGCGMRDRFGPA